MARATGFAAIDAIAMPATLRIVAFKRYAAAKAATREITHRGLLEKSLAI
jgi:hypothetical protein